MSGRPYTPEQREVIIAKVLEGLAKGTPLTVICREDGMPDDDTIRVWRDNDPDLDKAIARARDTGFDAIAQDAMNIVDEKPSMIITTSETGSSERIDPGHVAWAKNRAWTRLQLLAKWDPKRYGEMIKHAGSDGGALKITISDEDAQL